MAKTTELVEALRCSAAPGGPADDAKCEGCAYGLREEFGGEELWSCDCDRMIMDAAVKIEDLTDRCARYAEEIAVLQEEQKRVTAADVAPVVCGRWVHHDDGVVTCSECGNAESSDSYYCRYCGAKMDGGGERDG